MDILRVKLSIPFRSEYFSLMNIFIPFCFRNSIHSPLFLIYRFSSVFLLFSFLLDLQACPWFSLHSTRYTTQLFPRGQQLVMFFFLFRLHIISTAECSFCAFKQRQSNPIKTPVNTWLHLVAVKTFGLYNYAICNYCKITFYVARDFEESSKLSHWFWCWPSRG